MLYTQKYILFFSFIYALNIHFMRYTRLHALVYVFLLLIKTEKLENHNASFIWANKWSTTASVTYFWRINTSSIYFFRSICTKMAINVMLNEDKLQSRFCAGDQLIYWKESICSLIKHVHGNETYDRCHSTQVIWTNFVIRLFLLELETISLISLPLSHRSAWNA